MRSVAFRCFLHDLSDIVQKPAVDLGQLEDFIDRHAILERLREMENPLRVRDRELQTQASPRSTRVSRSHRRTNRSALISSERNAFCSASLKVRPIAIASPTLFICVVSVASACGNFSKVKRGTLTTQ